MTVPPGWGSSDVCTRYSNLKLLLPLLHRKLAEPVACAGVVSHHLEGGQDLMLLSWENKHCRSQIHFKEQSSWGEGMALNTPWGVFFPEAKGCLKQLYLVALQSLEMEQINLSVLSWSTTSLTYPYKLLEFTRNVFGTNKLSGSSWEVKSAGALISALGAWKVLLQCHQQTPAHWVLRDTPLNPHPTAATGTGIGVGDRRKSSSQIWENIVLMTALILKVFLWTSYWWLTYFGFCTQKWPVPDLFSF